MDKVPIDTDVVHEPDDTDVVHEPTAWLRACIESARPIGCTRCGQYDPDHLTPVYVRTETGDVLVALCGLCVAAERGELVR